MQREAIIFVCQNITLEFYTKFQTLASHCEECSVIEYFYHLWCHLRMSLELKFHINTKMEIQKAVGSQVSRQVLCLSPHINGLDSQIYSGSILADNIGTKHWTKENRLWLELTFLNLSNMHTCDCLSLDLVIQLLNDFGVRSDYF